MPRPSSVEYLHPLHFQCPHPRILGRLHICVVFFLLSVIQHKIKRILFAVEAAPALEGAGGGWKGRGYAFWDFVIRPSTVQKKKTRTLLFLTNSQTWPGFLRVVNSNFFYNNAS